MDKEKKRQYERSPKYKEWQRKYKKKRYANSEIKEKIHQYNTSEKRKEYMRKYLREYYKKKKSEDLRTKK